MTRRLKLRRQARTDLSEIWAFTARRWSTAQADRYLLGLNAIFSQLRTDSEISRLHDNFATSVRIDRYRSHLMIFTDDDTSVEVIRVVHSRSNWQAALSD